MSYFETLWNYLLASAPYLLLGLLVAGVIRSFLSVEIIKNKLGGTDFKSVFLASLFGVPLPLCSCSVIPAAVTLRKSGASNGSTSAFLISTPESGIDSIAMTYSLMDLPMTVIRPVVAFLSAFISGVLQNIFNHFQYQDDSVKNEKKSCCHSHKKNKSNKSIREKIQEGIWFAFNDLINDIAWWLAVGLLAGAAIEYFVPMDFFEGLAGWQGKLLVLGIGLPLYICASASTPIAASLVIKGMSPGTALILLLVGPATNFSNLAVLQKYLGKKGLVINIVVIALSALVSSYLVDALYAGKKLNWAVGSHHAGHHSLSTIISTIFLIFLILRGIYLKKLKRFF